MKRNKILALVLTGMMLTATCFAGCGDKKTTPTDTTTTTQMDKEQKITLNIGDDANTLDSCLATDEVSFTVLAQCFEGLARETNDGTTDKIVPGAAEKWDISKDGLVWTFHLRDLKWTDGKPVTAKDFEYAWKRLLNPKTGASYASFLYCIKGAEEYNSEKGKVEDVGIKAVDDKTFEVTLKAPSPTFEKTLAFNSFLPLRQDIVEAQGDKYGQDATKMVFCGPFTLSNWVRGSKFIFEKNKDYWDAKTVKLTEVTMLMVSDREAQMQMLQNKELDQTGAMGDWIAKLKKDAEAGKYQYVTGPRPANDYFEINQKCSNKMLTNKKVRMALALSFDRQKFLDTIYKRLMPAYGVVPYGIAIGDKEYRKATPEQLKDIQGQYSDMSKVKALFEEGCKEAGVDPSKATFKLLLRNGDSTNKKIGEYFQSEWQKNLGIKVDVDLPADFPTFLKRTKGGDYEVAFAGWAGDYNDPMTFLEMWKTGDGNNDAKYSNPEFDKLINQAKIEMDATKRGELYKQAEKVLIDDAGVIPIDFADRHSFIQPWVKGLQIPMFGADWELKNCYIQGRQ